MKFGFRLQPHPSYNVSNFSSIFTLPKNGQGVKQDTLLRTYLTGGVSFVYLYHVTSSSVQTQIGRSWRRSSDVWYIFHRCQESTGHLPPTRNWPRKALRPDLLLLPPSISSFSNPSFSSPLRRLGSEECLWKHVHSKNIREVGVRRRPSPSSLEHLFSLVRHLRLSLGLLLRPWEDV